MTRRDTIQGQRDSLDHAHQRHQVFLDLCGQIGGQEALEDHLVGVGHVIELNRFLDEILDRLIHLSH